MQKCAKPDERGFVVTDKHGNIKQIPITPDIVASVHNALAGEVLLDSEVDAPFWIGKAGTYERRNYLSAQDGLVDMDKLLDDGADFMLPHDPRWFSTVCLPYEVNHSGASGKWLSFLETSVRSRIKRGSDPKIELLQEFAGYLLCPNTDHQKFMVMVGEGSNGKSVACTVLTALLGEANVSNVPLELFGQRFALSSSLGKLANIASEIGEIDKAAEGYLKAFTDGSRMFFDRKGIPGVEARPTARLILATNNMPRFSDRSKGLWRRMIVMPFNKEITKDQQIKGMDKPAFWERELTGIFHWAVEGLRHLRDQGHFTEPEECRVALEEYRRDSNPARVFLEETCLKTNESVPTSDLYKAYREWCEQNGTHPLGERLFGKEVKRVFPNVEKTRTGSDGCRIWRYVGIAYSPTGWGEPGEGPALDAGFRQIS